MGAEGIREGTFAQTIAKVFGTYASNLQGKRVMEQHNQHLQWLAGLKGKRLVTVWEVPERGEWTRPP